jgi:hypothetical protein
MVSTIDRTCGLLVSDVHGRDWIPMRLGSCVIFAIPCTDFQAFALPEQFYSRSSDTRRPSMLPFTQFNSIEH